MLSDLDELFQEEPQPICKESVGAYVMKSKKQATKVAPKENVFEEGKEKVKCQAAGTFDEACHRSLKVGGIIISQWT